MLNLYSFQSNKILIYAPGNANNNRIKNDLIWDINKFLAIKFELYTFYTSRNPSDSFCCKRISTCPKKYISFQKLDDMFITPTTLSSTEINYYREFMDPLKKMEDDVFKEACCLENVDVEYIAVENKRHLFNMDIIGPPKKLWRKLSTNFPIYISLFGAKEVKIIINQEDLLKPILDIVIKHCVKLESQA